MDELEISGKRYLSSRRAAKDNGYHVDYIGQLIRSGKVVGAKVGRSWYVEKDSLTRYLAGEALVPPQISAAEVAPLENYAARVPAKTQTDEIPEVPLLTRDEEKDGGYRVAINKAPKVGLTYIADEAPLLPEIRPVLRPVYTAYVEKDPTEEVEGQVPLPVLEKKRSTVLPAIALVMVGGVVLVGVAASSVFINSRILLEQGKPAIVEYSLQK